MSGLRVSVLGGFSATQDSTTLTTFRSQKTQALLAYLAVESGRVHQRDLLIDLLWSEQPPKQANSNFRQSLSRLQKAIGNKKVALPYLVITRKAVQWDPSSDYVLDVEHFLRATDGALTQTDLAQAVDQVELACDLYHGDFLAGFFVDDAPGFEDWVTSTREQLHRQLLRALKHVADRAEAEGLLDQAIQLSRHHLTLDPSSEFTHRRLMRTLTLHGQRAEALAQFARCTEALREELEVAPSDETKQLHQLILDGKFSAPPTTRPFKIEKRDATKHESVQAQTHSTKHVTDRFHRLPTNITHFVGREQEVEEVAAYLEDPAARLVTLTGPGGMGKTSLALEVAKIASATRKHGAIFVPLAAVDKGDLLAPSILQVLGLPVPTEVDSAEYLLDYLEALDLLIVLDNYEQLLPIQSVQSAQETPPVDQTLLIAILERAPLITLFITSRVRLNLPQEWVYPLNGMTLPPALDMRVLEGETAQLTQFEQSNAVALFVYSAQKVHPAFSLTARNVHAVARICRLLEGTPLGIELAAAWVRALPCEEIGREIEASFEILTASSAHVPERHRSLYKLFDSSWQKLSAAAQEVVLRLSIFRSRFGRRAATEVADASIATLAELIDHSFVRRVGSGEYQMHELMRQLAAEKLAADAELTQQTQQTHGFYFARYLEERANPFVGGNDHTLFEIETRFGDISLAWRYLAAHHHFRRIDTALDGLNRFCRTRGHIGQGVELIENALDQLKNRPSKKNEISLFKARLISRLGGLYVSLGEHKKAHRLVTEALQLSEELRSVVTSDVADSADAAAFFDPNAGADTSRSLEATIAFCYWCLLFVPSATEDGEQVDLVYAMGLALYQKCGLQFGVANMHNIRGVIAHNRGDLLEAESLYQKSHKIFQAVDNYKGLSLTHHNLGKVNEELGNYGDGLTYLQQSLHYTYALNDDEAVAFVISSMARIGMYLGEYEEAEEQAKEALTKFEKIRFQQGVAFSCDLLGEILYLQGNYAEAEMFLTLGMEVCQKYRYPIEAALVATNHGHLALHLFEVERAHAFAQQALTFAQQARSRSAEGPAHTLLGEIAVAQEEFDVARDSFEKAIAIGKEISAPLVWLKAQAGLAELALRVKDETTPAALLHEILVHKATTQQLHQRVAALT